MRKLERAGVAVLVIVAACIVAWWASRYSGEGSRYSGEGFGPHNASAPWPFRPQPETLRITFDAGGRITDYIERYSALRLSGGRVIIDGLCISACTMVTGLMPPERVCVTAYAQLAFHSAAQMNPFTGERAHSSEGTRLVWNLYPEKVRALLRAKSWDGEDAKVNEHPDLIYVAGDELRTLIRPCAPSEM